MYLLFECLSEIDAVYKTAKNSTKQNANKIIELYFLLVSNSSKKPKDLAEQKGHLTATRTHMLCDYAVNAIIYL